MILYLVAKGADPRIINRDGQSTADMANGPVQRTQPYPEALELLVKLGAKNKSKKFSPVYIAGTDGSVALTYVGRAVSFPSRRLATDPKAGRLPAFRGRWSAGRGKFWRRTLTQ